MEIQNIIAVLILIPWALMVFGEHVLRNKLTQSDFRRLTRISYFSIVPTGYVAVKRLILIFQGICPTGRFQLFSLEGFLIGIGVVYGIGFFLYFYICIKRKGHED